MSRLAFWRRNGEEDEPPNDDPERYGRVRFGEPLTRQQSAFRTFSRNVTRTIGRPYFKIQVVGEDKLPTEGPAIIAPSHRSNLDTPLIGIGLQRLNRYMAKGSMFKNPLFTWVLVAYGGFPVRRGTTDRRTLKNAMAVLEQGEALVVFPEGARQDGPRILPLFEGSVWLASRAGVPIYPLGIGGSARAMPISTLIPRPRRVTFVIGDPMDPPAPLPGKRRVSRAQLDAFSAELRERVQMAFDESQRLAGTPNGPWPPEESLVRREPWDGDDGDDDVAEA